jgi:hypothetical protein
MTADTLLPPLAQCRAATLREALEEYRIRMPRRATKQQLYDRLLLAMRLHAAMLQR